jgi:hypothetical protein
LRATLVVVSGKVLQTTSTPRHQQPKEAAARGVDGGLGKDGIGSRVSMAVAWVGARVDGRAVCEHGGGSELGGERKWI